MSGSAHLAVTVPVTAKCAAERRRRVPRHVCECGGMQFAAYDALPSTRGMTQHSSHTTFCPRSIGMTRGVIASTREATAVHPNNFSRVLHSRRHFLARFALGLRRQSCIIHAMSRAPVARCHVASTTRTAMLGLDHGELPEGKEGRVADCSFHQLSCHDGRMSLQGSSVMWRTREHGLHDKAGRLAGSGYPTGWDAQLVHHADMLKQVPQLSPSSTTPLVQRRADAPACGHARGLMRQCDELVHDRVGGSGSLRAG